MVTKYQRLIDEKILIAFGFGFSAIAKIIWSYLGWCLEKRTSGWKYHEAAGSWDWTAKPFGMSRLKSSIFPFPLFESILTSMFAAYMFVNKIRKPSSLVQGKPFCNLVDMQCDKGVILEFLWPCHLQSF